MASLPSCWKIIIFCIYSAFLLSRLNYLEISFSDISLVSLFRSSIVSFCKQYWVWTVFRALDSSVYGCILDPVFCQVPLTWLFKHPWDSNTRFAGNILTVVYDFITPSFRRRTFRISVFDIYPRAESIAM